MSQCSSSRATGAILVAFAFLGLSLAPRSAEAQEPMHLLERTHDVVQEVEIGYGGLVKFTAGPTGGVHVTAWKKQLLRIEAHIVIHAPSEADLDQMTSVIGLLIDPSPTSVEVVTKGPHEDKWIKGIKNFPKQLRKMPWSVDYVLFVPEYTGLDLAVYNGDTTVEGVNGIVSALSASGNILISDVAGPTRANAANGSVEITTHERTWRGGNLVALAGHDVALKVPHGFSGWFDMQAPGGISIEGEKTADLGHEHKGKIGVGGVGVTLTAVGRIILTIGNAPPEPEQEPTAEPEPQATSPNR